MTFASLPQPGDVHQLPQTGRSTERASIPAAEKGEAPLKAVTGRDLRLDFFGDFHLDKVKVKIAFAISLAKASKIECRVACS